MSSVKHNRRSVTLNVDTLEGRALLSGYAPGLHAATPHVQVAAVHAAPAVHVTPACHHAKAAVTGTLTGTSSYTGSTEGTDTYNLSGNTTWGAATVTGTDSYISNPLNADTYSDLYYNGNWKMKLSNGETLQIAYTGKGNSPVSGTGPWSQKIAGTAIVISGAHLGKTYAFGGNLSGTYPGQATTAKITLK